MSFSPYILSLAHDCEIEIQILGAREDLSLGCKVSALQQCRKQVSNGKAGSSARIPIGSFEDGQCNLFFQQSCTTGTRFPWKAKAT
jgi:hypothetical protein